MKANNTWILHARTTTAKRLCFHFCFQFCFHFPVFFSSFNFISIFCFSICQSSRTLQGTTYVFLAGRTPLRVYCSPPRFNSVLTTLTIIVAVSCFRHVNWPGSVQDDYFFQQVNKHRPCCFMAWVDSIDYWQKVTFQLLCCMSPYSVDKNDTAKVII